MITPVGVLQENKEAALTAITELEKAIADNTENIASYRTFIAQLNVAIATLERIPAEVVEKAPK